MSGRSTLHRINNDKIHLVSTAYSAHFCLSFFPVVGMKAASACMYGSSQVTIEITIVAGCEWRRVRPPFLL